MPTWSTIYNDKTSIIHTIRLPGKAIRGIRNNNHREL